MILFSAFLLFPVSNASAEQIGRSYSGKYFPDYGGYTIKAHAYSVAWSFLYRKKNPVKAFYQKWQNGSYKKQCGKKLSVSDCAMKAIKSQITVTKSGRVYSSSKKTWRNNIENALKNKYVAMIDEYLVVYAAVIKGYNVSSGTYSYCFYWANTDGKKGNRCESSGPGYNFADYIVNRDIKILKKR